MLRPTHVLRVWTFLFFPPVHSWKPLHPNALPTAFVSHSTYPPFHPSLTTFPLSLLLFRHKSLLQMNLFSSPSPNDVHCLNVTSLAIWLACLSPLARYKQALSCEDIWRKNRQRVCLYVWVLRLIFAYSDRCPSRSFLVGSVKRWNCALK